MPKKPATSIKLLLSSSHSEVSGFNVLWHTSVNIIYFIFLWLFLYQSHVLQRLQVFFANPPFSLSCWVCCQGAMTSCCNFSLTPFGLGGGGGGTRRSGPLDSRPERLRNDHWLIAEVGMLKKIKITFWPSLLPLSIAALNHFPSKRSAARVFIYERLFGRRLGCCSAAVKCTLLIFAASTQ